MSSAGFEAATSNISALRTAVRIIAFALLVASFAADAADEAGLSRLYGGIHVWPDDLLGREMGAEIGLLAWEMAQTLYG